MVKFCNFFSKAESRDVRGIDRRGAVLLTTIIVLLFVSVLGLALMTFLINRTAHANLELDRLKAYYLAEAGIAQSVHELRLDNDLDGNGVGNVLRKTLAGGYFKAVHNFQSSTITGVGEFNGIQRVLQIKYSAL